MTPRCRQLPAIFAGGLLAASATLVGCGSQTQLEPTPGAPTTVAEDVAITDVEGVELRVEVDAWPGEYEVVRHVTPVKVTMINRGAEPVRFEYRRFALRAPDGRRYAALPPFAIRGEITIDRAIEPLVPTFYHRDFVVAPWYGTYYPRLGVWGSRFAYDWGYYDHYFGYWRAELPTREMLELALPEGVLDPGGQVTGYLYFELVEDADRVNLQADIVTAEGTEIIGQAAIPFDVEG
jgi:hypothetical protein